MILSATNLERLRWAHQSWTVLYNENLQRLNDTLLKVSGMLDVQITSLTDGDVLQWNGTYWVNVSSGFLTTT